MRHPVLIFSISFLLCAPVAFAQNWNTIPSGIAGKLGFDSSIKVDEETGSDAKELELLVRYLSDEAREGRVSGSRGAVDAAMLVGERFRSAGLETVPMGFSLPDGKTGRNIIGTGRSAKSNCRWIIVMAHYDGVTASDGRSYPGADSNASGTAALILLADKLKENISHGGCNVLFAALDGHYFSLAGARALWEALPSLGISPSRIEVVVNLDTMGSILAPPQRFWKNYLIALGGSRFESSLGPCNSGLEMHLYFDYYESRAFTDMFYRKVSDQRIFLENGVPCVMFTSGITMNTNRLSDTDGTLNYPIFAKRVELIRRWLGKLISGK